MTASRMSRQVRQSIQYAGFLLIIAGAISFAGRPSLGFPFCSGNELVITALLVLLGYALIATAESGQRG